MKQWHIQHPQDRMDAESELRGLKYPYRLMAVSQRPKDGNEAEAWKKMNSFFHRGIVPTYAKLSGLGEDESKEDLQRRFALVVEYADHYEVESIAGMSNQRLSQLIESCQQFLIQNFGEVADEMLINNINKTKIIKK